MQGIFASFHGSALAAPCPKTAEYPKRMQDMDGAFPTYPHKPADILCLGLDRAYLPQWGMHDPHLSVRSYQRACVSAAFIPHSDSRPRPYLASSMPFHNAPFRVTCCFHGLA
ncbi:hypothetical protein DL89DRAFT_266240 [Linderina pennispora]|uniref:Uncharacterized protein n=1 Tax=Linderina pennispora TaxID=61395 RepID=A0A1Y1WCG7_9FUNG|nr:uncharacterized protein DL89DRAFT_266240 [Linderina pennispora]ORX71230.1 hypothetical protein DL89DRAFT_266240 [Linderina pennispora]